MNKNEAGKWIVFAYGNPDHASAGLPITGDAANITANIRIDGAAANAVDDTNPTELEDGYYIFDITAVESNGDNLLLAPASSTANVLVIGVPGSVYTRPANFNDLSITATNGRVDLDSIGGTAQTANDNGADINQLLVDVADVPNNSEFNARTLPTADYISTNGGVIKTLDDLDIAQDLEHAITQDLVGNISSSSGAISQNATSFTATSVVQTLTYTETHEEDASLHELAPSVGVLDCEYLTTLPDSGALSSVTLFCYVTSNADEVAFQFWDYTSSSFKTELTQGGTISSTLIPLSVPATTAYTGTGVNLGEVRFRVLSSGANVVTSVGIDRLTFNYAVIQNTLGFEGGAVWFDSNNGESGTSTGIGTISRPSSVEADARTIADANNLKIIHCLPQSLYTLDQSYIGYELKGFGYSVSLNGQDIASSAFENAEVTGIATSSDGRPSFIKCFMGAVTLPPSVFDHSGIGKDDGQFTAGSAGSWDFGDCKSLVPGSGSPDFDFTIGSGLTTIANNGWFGGATYVLDSTVTLTHGVVVGGGTTITTGGADCEIRGTTRSISLTLSGSETIQFVGIAGTVTYGGVTSGIPSIVNLHGVVCSVVDNTTGLGVTLTNPAVSLDNINIEADTALEDMFTSSAQLVDDIVDEPLTKATHNIANSLAKRLRDLSSILIRADTAQGAGTGNNQIQFDASASAIDGAYDPAIVSIIDGTGSGQTRLILQYSGTTKTATVDRDWKVNPDATSEYVIVGDSGREHVNEGLAQAGSSTTITLNALASPLDDAYVGQVVFPRSGTGADQARTITSYNGTTKVATVEAWGTIPDTTTGYVINPLQVFTLQQIIDNTGFATEAKQDATDIVIAELTVQGDTNETKLDNIPTTTEFEARTPTAGELLYMTRHAASAKPVTFSGTGTTTTGTMALVDGVAPSSNNDVYNGAVLVFNAGTNDEVRTDITGYVGSSGEVTVTAVPFAIDSSNTALLV